MTKTDERQTRKQKKLLSYFAAVLCGWRLGVNRRRSKEAISRKDAKAQKFRKDGKQKGHGEPCPFPILT